MRKNRNGIKTVRRRFGQYENRIDFEDREEWVIAPSNEYSRGYRCARRGWMLRIQVSLHYIKLYYHVAVYINGKKKNILTGKGEYANGRKRSHASRSRYS